MKRKMPTIDTKKLRKLYDDFVKLYNSQNFATLTRREQVDKVYALFLAGLNKTNPPQILGKEDYNSYRGEVLYRGANDIMWQADLLVNPHPETFGSMGRAAYASNERKRAENYDGGDPENILTFKLKVGARAIYTANLIDNFFVSRDHPVPDEPIASIQELSLFLQDLPNGSAKTFLLDALTENLCFVALLAGYDMVFTPVSSKENYYQVINREVMMVSQEEYERIISKTVQTNLDILSALQNEFSLVKSGKIHLSYKGYDIPECTLSNYLYRYALYLCCYDLKPQVIKDVDLIKLANPPKGATFPTIYRGMSSLKHIQELLCEEEYHLGEGVHGQGLYFSPDYATATTYAKGENQPVLTAHLDPSTRLINSSDIYEVMGYLENMTWDDYQNRYDSWYYPSNPLTKCLCKKINDAFTAIHNDDTDDFIEVLLRRPSTIAILLGYDGLIPKDTVMVIHNRGKLILSQSEYKRVTDPNSRPAEEKTDEYSEKDYEAIKNAEQEKD